MASTVPSTDTIPPSTTPDEFITFPDHPLFKRDHPTLLSFDDYIPGGILVSKHTSDDNQQRQRTTDDTESTTLSIIETDASFIPTVILPILHSNKQQKNVIKVSKVDAWRLGKDGLEEEEWMEPVGTWKGEFEPEKRPFDRALRALEQFLNSRSLALTRLVHYPLIRKFRNAILLQPSNSGPHIPGPISLPPGSQIPEDVENCLFLTDLEGCLKAYWRQVMEEGGKGWNMTTAYNSFEIVNSFLHYLSLTPFLPEPIFSIPLHRILPISRLYLRRMYCAGMLYQHFGNVETREGWIGLVASTWVKDVKEDRKDDGWKKLVNEDTEEDEDDSPDGLEEDEEEEHAVGDWGTSVAELPDAVFSELSTKQATVKMQSLIAPSLVDNFKCVKTHSAAVGTITSATIASASTTQIPFPCIQNLVRLQVDVQPADHASGEPPIKTVIFIDRSPEMIIYAKGNNSIVNAAVGLKVIGTFAQIKGIRSDGEEVGFWLVIDVDKVSPPMEDQ